MRKLLYKWAIETESRCQNCRKPLDESLLVYCSTKCQFEDYLNSQTGGQTTMKTKMNPN